MSIKLSLGDPEIIQVQLLKIDHDKKLLICFVNNEDDKNCIVRYDISPDNNIFTPSVEQFWEGAKLNLVNSYKDQNGFLIPTYIILEPDYLIDASAIAECFQDYLISPIHYFRNRFEKMENRSYLLLGNLANFFLDELVFAEEVDNVSFENIFLKSFKQSPFEYTSCEDIRSESDFRSFMNRAQQLFNNIKRVVRYDFPKMGININFCTLEPSFFSVKYGFQGRLDLLYTNPITNDTRIIELKSGRLPYPAFNTSKITLNHKVQTYVYRLMIDSVFYDKRAKVEASILYASGNNPGENIRKANIDGDLEKSILNLRNLIIINEHKIITGELESVESMFKSMLREIETENPVPVFYQHKINRFQNVLTQSSDIERIYFYRFIQFVSRELYHQKTGDMDYETPTGMASLWNSSFDERAEALNVLYDLSILNIDDSANDMTIIFSRPQPTREDENLSGNNIVNFREGDICIVYPREDVNDTVLNKQILKGTIVRITPEKVEVRFRYKQKNRHYFEDNQFWAIEHDSLDSSLNSMYKSLFEFISSSKQKRELLLGIKQPKCSAIKQENSDINDISYPENIINQALNAEDYFLIVGPPGTGKTSIFARRLIEEYYKKPDVNIMVIAYTNRAVDELCGAINAAFGYSDGDCDKYIRVGSELSCDSAYQHRLLQRVSEKAADRDSLRKEINDTRIFISTLASITGKMELFSLKQFQIAIIDEASQILEPQIIGLLPLFDKFIMIGDHNQLATIVLQEEEKSRINETQLQEIGITDCRESFFERLLRRCKSQGWTHSFTQLTHQGRMHSEIAAFPSTYFYSENLFPALDWQTGEWRLSNVNGNFYDKYIATKRTILFSTEKKENNIISNKINQNEAEIIAELLESIQRVYNDNNITYDSSKIGIIAPYRNQIALIRHKLSEARIDDYENIMIDTVERFQGSQRDIIIVSFCINQPGQFRYLCNLNHDGTVDRKLNVALTRARQQLFLVGNAQLLLKHPIYES
ncbi:MAG: AAA domain-containing protein, partial [Bacteroidales bacterium]